MDADCWIRFPDEFVYENLGILSHLNQNIEGWAAPWDRVAFGYEILRLLQGASGGTQTAEQPRPFALVGRFQTQVRSIRGSNRVGVHRNQLYRRTRSTFSVFIYTVENAWTRRCNGLRRKVKGEEGNELEKSAYVPMRHFDTVFSRKCGKDETNPGIRCPIHRRKYTMKNLLRTLPVILASSCWPAAQELANFVGNVRTVRASDTS